MKTILLLGDSGLLLLGGLFLWAMGRQPTGASVLTRTTEQSEAQAPTPGIEMLTVVTWNIHYGCGPELSTTCNASAAEIRAYLRTIAERLKAWEADIVALQEVDRDAFRTHSIDQLEVLQRETGMPYAAWTRTWDAGWVPSPGLSPARHIGSVVSGQAILSRYPIERVARHALAQPDSNSWIYNRFYLHRALLEARVKVAPELTLRVINAHLEAFARRNRQRHAQTLRRLIEAERTPTLVLGDMNSIPPEAPQRKNFPDEPDTDFSADTTMPTLLGTRLRDTLTAVAGKTEHYPTFTAANPSRRLDYILAERDWPVMDAHVPAVVASDHLPVVTKLRVAK